MLPDVLEVEKIESAAQRLVDSQYALTILEQIRGEFGRLRAQAAAELYRRDGVSYADIGRRLGMTRQSVREMVEGMGETETMRSSSDGRAPGC